MRAYIYLEGHECLINSIDWHKENISNISLYDKNNRFRTIFQTHIGSDSPNHADIKNNIIWKED